MISAWRAWQSVVGKISYHYLKSADVRIAETDEEIHAIQRMIYSIYVEERQYSFPGIDYENRIVTSPEDRASSARFLYIPDEQGIQAAVRINTWPREEVPEGVAADLSLDLLPGLEGLNITEICRLVVRSDCRGSPTAAASVLLRAFEDAINDFGGDLGFVYCAPGLVSYYLNMGFRPYGGRLVDVEFTSMIPVVMIPSDVEALKACNSFMAPAAEKIFGSGKRLDTSAFDHLLRPDNLPVVVDKEKILAILEALGQAGCEFLDGLNAKDFEALARSAFGMGIEAGRVLTSTGTRETEIYLVYEGHFEVLAHGKVVAYLGPGDVIGEVAFFTTANVRTATVRASEDSKVLVLKRSSVMRLLDGDPEAGAKVLFNLSRTLASRLVKATERFAGTEAEVTRPPTALDEA